MLPALSQCVSQLSSTAVRGIVRASHSITASNEKRLAQWNQAVSNAEKIVGSPNSSLAMNLLMSDVSLESSHLKKLMNTGHPIIKTVNKFIYNNPSNVQMRALVVLLLSRSAGHIEDSPEMLLGEWEEAIVDGLTGRQRSLSEIIEMIYLSHLIHRDVLNLSREFVTDESVLKELQYGNKLAILVGDVLIANASKKTSELNNCKVLKLIANSIGNFTKSEFVVRHDLYGKPLPPKSMTSSEWEKRISLDSGSLLATACQAAVLMAGHGDSVQQRASDFGNFLGLIWQLHDELEAFANNVLQAPHKGVTFDLTSLPCVLFLERNPHIIESLEASYENIVPIDYLELLKKISASGCVEEASQRLNNYVRACLANLDTFNSCSKAKEALAELVQAVKRA